MKEQKQTAPRKKESKSRNKKTTVGNSASLPSLQNFFRITQKVVAEQPGKEFVIIHWDIDSFKVFNNLYGTEAGDKLLSEIARRCALLKKQNPAVVSYGYMGADHFLLCWDGEAFDPDNAWQTISALVQASFPEYTFAVKCGLRSMDSSMEVSAACEQALLALRSIKGRYDVNYVWYDEKMLESRLKEIEITSTMKEALRRGDFVPYFQPQYNHLTGEMIGMEALARWIHPEKGLLSPALFIPVFERTGFIFEMDKCIWEKACACLRRWMDAGLKPPPLSVNVSRKSLYHPCFIPSLNRVVEQYNIGTDMLHLEITESAYMENKEQLLSIIGRLHDLGFRVEMDDFGSGFSSLNFLKDVPVDLIKLDTEFLSMKNGNRGKGGNILSSVIRLAHGINLDIIAEGVEDKHQADLLKSLGCIDMQGYYFARPMTEAQLTDLLATGKVASRTENRMDTGVDMAVDFLDDTTQSALLFNSFVGGAAILEYRGDTAAILRMNDKFFDVLGVSVEEYREQQLRVMESFTPETRAAYKEMLETAIRTGEEAECESCSVNLCSHNEPVWLHNRVRFLARKVDSYLFYLAVENITHKKTLEENNRRLIISLEKERQMQAKILDNIPAAVALFRIRDGQMVCDHLSKGAKELLAFGGDYDNALDILRHMERLTHHGAGKLDEKIKAAMEGKPELINHDFCICTEEGLERWLNLSASPHYDDDGSLCYFGIYTDVTERKHGEMMRRLREAEYRSVVRQCRKVICRYNLKNRSISMMEESAKLMGLPPCVQNGPETFVSNGNILEESIQEWKSVFAAIDAGQEKGQLDEMGMRYHDGSVHWYSMQYTCVRVDNELLDNVTLAFEDITEEHLAEKEKTFQYAAMFKALHRVYPMTIACNLSKNTFYVLENENYIHHNMGRSGTRGNFDELIAKGMDTLPPEERRQFMQTFGRESLLSRFEAGEDTIELEHHQYDDNGQLHWVKTTVLLIDNPDNDDILELTMGQCIDRRKADEEQLKAQLTAASDILAINEKEAELRVAMSKHGRAVCHYDWKSRTITLPKEYAAQYGFPRSFSITGGRPSADVKKARQRAGLYLCLRKALRRGDLNGQEEISYLDENGNECWERAEFVTLFDAERNPVRTLLALEDTSADHQTEEVNEELHFSKHILRLVAEHSGRLIYYLDLESKTIQALDRDECTKAGLPHSMRMDASFLYHRITVVGGDTVDTMVEKIRKGVPRGDMKAQIRGMNNKRQWFDIHYSTIWNEHSEIIGAIVSLLDVTQLHRQELAYERYQQSMDGADRQGMFYLEVDLTADQVEQAGGSLLGDSEKEWLDHKSYSQVLEMLMGDLFTDENRAQARSTFSRENLLGRFGQEGLPEEDWQVIFPKKKVRHWLRIAVELLQDSYTGHIRAFITMNNVTAEKEAFLQVQRRAELDGLTGAYNRASVEAMVNKSLQEMKEGAAALVLLDLDELKVINDRFGHQQGDYVLRKLSEILMEHFDSTDVVGRVGGDEFVVFVPRVSSEAVLRRSVQSMMDKFLVITLGENGEYQVHCSVGIALASPGRENFADLYRNADLALYHIKRNGKNNYIMFTPEMLEAGFQYQGHREVTLKDNRLFSGEELSSFLSMVAELYPMVFSMNLSRNTIYLMEEGRNFNSTLPKYGSLSDFLESYRKTIQQEEWTKAAAGENQRSQLMNAYRAGKTRLTFVDRQLDDAGRLRPVETKLLMYENSSGEICGFALVRPLEENEQ